MTSDRRPSLWSLFKSFFILGTISFGAGMFAVIHQLVVEDNHWLTEEEFRDVVMYSELAPGPFTVHVVMYIGYHLLGWRGLITCTLAFCLPSVLIILIVVGFFSDWIKAIPGKKYFMMGVWASILASMVSTVIRIGQIVFKPFLVLLILLNLALVIFYKMDFAVLVVFTGLIYVGVVRVVGGGNGRGNPAPTKN